MVYWKGEDWAHLKAWTLLGLNNNNSFVISPWARSKIFGCWYRVRWIKLILFVKKFKYISELKNASSFWTRVSISVFCRKWWYVYVNLWELLRSLSCNSNSNRDMTVKHTGLVARLNIFRSLNGCWRHIMWERRHSFLHSNVCQLGYHAFQGKTPRLAQKYGETSV